MTGANRIKHTFRLPPTLSSQLADYARAKRVSQAQIVETAIASFLSPDGSERIEAALGRRLDRMTRQAERLSWRLEVASETLAIFVLSWLTATPPVPEGDRASAEAQAWERWYGLIEIVRSRIETGKGIMEEMSRDIPGR
ncbi:CopG family transcriptional regulator [Sphingomonas glacialis]|uniref:CopG family transcriptional regulator n=1 Tax=Sphingomonas glacialis TaxID=658225 RepID=A0A502FFQ2_9SPHN|nr:CopG family transcriptional regulator [Sphingomonas glacialis]TPG48062.1 CopG family transcriptional regulator [Sphingomonas glacialis]